MRTLTVAALIVSCMGLNHASVIKPSSSDNCNTDQNQVQATSGNNELKNQNFMKTIDVHDQRLREIKPNKQCSRDDIRKTIRGGFVFPEAFTSFLIGTGLATGGFVTGSAGGALGIASHRLKNGDFSGAVTGALPGLTHGGLNGGASNFYRGYRSLLGEPNNEKVSPNDCWDSFENQIQTAMDNNDSGKVKELLQQCSCKWKKQIYDEKSEQTRQHMIKTAGLIDQEIKGVNPDQDCSCEDYQQFIKSIVLFIKIAIGFGLGTGLGTINGLAQPVNEGIETSLCRLKNGDLQGTVTGIPPAVFYGLVQGGNDGLFTGQGLTLQK